jgi:hypothetical protein
MASGQLMVAEPVQRPETTVMYLEAVDGDGAAIGAAWDRLEQLVGLRGRHFLGAFDTTAGWYRTCVQLRDGDDPAALGLPTTVLPGGTYLCTRLHGQAPAVYDRLASTYAELERTGTLDTTRPGIEYYRRADEIDVLMPVLAD